jgi:hypothetical protein
LTGWVVEAAKVRHKERRKPSFTAVREEKWRSLDGAMVTGVVSKHESRNVDLPVQGRVINKRSQVFGDGLVADFCMAVALRMVAGSGEMSNIQQ